jgi:2,3-bisphosphoglycerate-independent phosphoglycerate mutase
LRNKDFVFVHVEAPDECGHMGNAELKIKAIESFDREIVGPVWKGLESMGQPYNLIIGTDHRTPVCVRNHSSEPVPLALMRGPAAGSGVESAFDEFIGGGEVYGMAFDVIRAILKNDIEDWFERR